MPASPGFLKKIRYLRAGEPARLCQLGGAARDLLDAEASPADYLHRLMSHGQRVDAVRFLAQALPPREAVWWACVCAKTGLDGAEPPVLAAHDAAQAWVYQPSEANRRRAYEAAQATDFQAPSSWAAVAAFWSGGSMAPADAPEVPPPPGMAGRAVAAAVILSAVRAQPEHAEHRLELFLSSGLDIGDGGNGRLRAEAAPAGAEAAQ